MEMSDTIPEFIFSTPEVRTEVGAHLDPLKKRKGTNSMVRFMKNNMYKLQAHIKQTKETYYKMVKELRDIRRYNAYELNLYESDLLDTKQHLLDADDESYRLQEELKLLEEECFWKGVHRKHIREDLNDLKKKHRGKFITCQDVLTCILENTNTEDENKQQQHLSPWQRLKKFIGLRYISKTKLREEQRNKRTVEVLSDVLNDFDGIVKSVDDFYVGQYATYPPMD